MEGRRASRAKRSLARSNATSRTTVIRDRAQPRLEAPAPIRCRDPLEAHTFEVDTLQLGSEEFIERCPFRVVVIERRIRLGGFNLHFNERANRRRACDARPFAYAAAMGNAAIGLTDGDDLVATSVQLPCLNVIRFWDYPITGLMIGGRFLSAVWSTLKTLYSERYGHLLKLLVAARKASGLSQQAVADKLDRPQSFVSKYESGERRLDVVELLKLADVIGFDANQIVRLLRSQPEIPRKLRKKR